MLVHENAIEEHTNPFDFQEEEEEGLIINESNYQALCNSTRQVNCALNSISHFEGADNLLHEIGKVLGKMYDYKYIYEIELEKLRRKAV